MPPRLHQTDLALRRWVDDTKLVLDRLATSPQARWPGRLVLSSVRLIPALAR